MEVSDVKESPRNPGLTLVEFQASADALSEMRIDVFEDSVIREATPEEAEATEARWDAELDHIGRTIDTGREGT